MQVAKLLLKRGAKAGVRDSGGCTAFDLAMKRGRVADDELFLLLATAS